MNWQSEVEQRLFSWLCLITFKFYTVRMYSFKMVNNNLIEVTHKENKTVTRALKKLNKQMSQRDGRLAVLERAII